MLTRLEQRRWFRRHFCEVQQLGPVVSMRSGVIGKLGTESRETFDSELEAIALVLPECSCIAAVKTSLMRSVRSSTVGTPLKASSKLSLWP